MYAPTTTFVSDDLAMGWQTAFSLDVSVKPIADSAKMARTINGKLVNLADDAFNLYSISLSSGSNDMRPPALSDMWAGKEIQIVPTFEMSDVIAVGGTSRTLSRDPHPNSIRCLDLNFNDIPFTISGRVLTLDAAATATTRIYYRPIFDVVVTSPWTVSAQDNRGTVTWSIQFEEQGDTL